MMVALSVGEMAEIAALSVGEINEMMVVLTVDEMNPMMVPLMAVRWVG
jgi:hypothetical protein